SKVTNRRVPRLYSDRLSGGEWSLLLLRLKNFLEDAALDVFHFEAKQFGDGRRDIGVVDGGNAAPSFDARSPSDKNGLHGRVIIRKTVCAAPCRDACDNFLSHPVFELIVLLSGQNQVWPLITL